MLSSTCDRLFIKLFSLKGFALRLALSLPRPDEIYVDNSSGHDPILHLFLVGVNTIEPS